MTINSKEIMLGNYFKIHNSIIVISSITENFVTYHLLKDDREIKDYFTSSVSDLKPIFIDNIEKLGFNKNNFVNLKELFYHNDKDFYIEKNEDYYNFYFLDNYIKSVKFLHELQNVYFTINKEIIKYEEVLGRT